MLRRLAISGLACVTWLGALNQDADAAFHLWDISEVYSNADGSVQFIELFTEFDFQDDLDGHTVTTSANSNTFTFPLPNSLGTNTDHRHLLLATAGFGSLPGGVTPDYTISANFFSTAINTLETINFGEGTSTANLFNAPTDGINSLNFPGGVAVNSPTNFAGDIGELVPPPVLGDMDGSGMVNAADVAPFIQALVNPDQFAIDHSTVNANVVGNVNGDGLFDLGDIAEFQTLVNASTTAVAQSVPEPSTFLLVAMLSCGFVVVRRRRC